MQDRELEKILEQREDKNIEFKEAFPKQSHELAKKMVAFANTEGGIIFIGIKDDGTISGVDNSVKTDERLTGIAKECDPPIKLEISKIKKDLGTIVMAKVPHKPLCCYKGRVYIRDNASSRAAKSNEIIEIASNVLGIGTYSVEYTKLESSSDSEKIISKNKLRNKALKGYILTLISIVTACMYLFFGHTSFWLVNMILSIVLAAFFAIATIYYGNEMFLYKTIFFNSKNLKDGQSIFVGNGRFIQNYDKKSFLIYQPSAKCIYPYCDGEIIVVDAPPKEILKTGKAYVGICSVAKKDHPYDIDYNRVAKKKDIDWSPLDKT